MIDKNTIKLTIYLLEELLHMLRCIKKLHLISASRLDNIDKMEEDTENVIALLKEI